MSKLGTKQESESKSKVRLPLRRRLMRFGLRGLLVLITLCALAFAYFDYYYLSVRRSFDELAAAGCYFDTQVPEGGVKEGLLHSQLLNWAGVETDPQLVFELVDENGKLKSLEPLRSFPNLALFSSESSQVDDLEPLAKLKGLRWLKLNGTQIRDLSPLKDLSNLELLDISDTPVSTLKPLASLDSLVRLDATETRISDLDGIEGMTAIRRLNFDYCQITDLSPLASMKQLEVVEFSSNPITDLNPLEGLEQLKRIDLSATQVADLSPLRGTRQLSYVNLAGTFVADLTPLSGNIFRVSNSDGPVTMPTGSKRQDSIVGLVEPAIQREFHSGGTNGDSESSNLKSNSADKQVAVGREMVRGIEHLDISRTKVQSLRPLKGMSRMRKIVARGSQLNDLQGLETTKLIRLDLSDTPVSDLSPLVRLPNLVDLTLENTKNVKSLDALRNLPKLSNVLLSNCAIKNLDGLEACTSLRRLAIERCSELNDVSALADLKKLDRLTLVDVPKLKKLPSSIGTQISRVRMVGTSIVDFSPLCKLGRLEKIYLGASQEKVLEFLANLECKNVLETLNLNDTRIESGVDLSHFTNLHELGLINCELESLDVLKSVRREIGYLNLYGSDISSLEDLSDCDELYWLNLAKTDVRDLSPISELRSMKTLLLSSTRIRDLAPIAGLRGIEILDIADTLVEDLGPLRDLTKLDLVDVTGLEIDSFESLLGSRETLKALILSRTNIQDLKGISNFTNLQSLAIDGMGIRDLSMLAGLESFRSLDIRGFQVDDSLQLDRLRELREIDLRDCRLVDLSSLSELDRLNEVVVNSDQMDSPEVQKFRKLSPRCVVLNEMQTDGRIGRQSWPVGGFF